MASLLVILLIVCIKQISTGVIIGQESIIGALTKTKNDASLDSSSDSAETQILSLRQDEDEDEIKTPLIPWSTPRIQDFASGLTGIIQGLFKGNPEQFLEGSFEFIPPGVRGGVKGILSSIVGRPIAQSKTTTTGVPVLRTTTIDGEGGVDNEEDVV